MNSSQILSDSPSVHGFSVTKASSLVDIPRGGRVHIIGVCGVAMAPLAVLLAQEGFRVSGSDREFYEPMGSVLRGSSVRLLHGYNSEHVTPDIDLVIIGNSARATNPEVEAVSKLKLRYSLFPKLLADVVIDGRHSIVVTGTHGKSTTTAMTAKLLGDIERKPSFFFGAQSFDYELNARVDAGQVSVVEGDEYDSAFFAKYPKFHFYRPNTLIITSIEFDHADIYPDIEAIVVHFRTLIASVPSDGRIFACLDYPFVRDLINETSHQHVVTYGTTPNADVMVNAIQREACQEVSLRWKDGRESHFKLPLVGAFNALNGAAAFLAVQAIGGAEAEMAESIATYRGLRRRQEVLVANAGVTILDDFAHHPTAVRVTLEGLRRRFTKERLWAIFEPRSNTSRRKVFEDDYLAAFDMADRVIIKAVEARPGDENIELIDTSKLVAALRARGKEAYEFTSIEDLYQSLIAPERAERVIVLMSNGAFGGLAQRLKDFFG